MTLKTTVTLEHGNFHERNAFLKDLRGLMLKWGSKAPKVKIRVVLETEAEHGLPDDLSLLDLGIAPDGTAGALTPLERELARAADVEAINTPSRPPAPPEPPAPPSLPAQVLHGIAAHGPMTAAALAAKLGRPLDEVQYTIDSLHAKGDLEPDDGGAWRLNDDDAE